MTLWSNVCLSERCAEPITQAYRLKVKVTVKGHEFEPWIWCSLHISWTLWKIFIKFGPNVRLSEMMCAEPINSTMRTQGQGHDWSPPVWALNFEAALLSFCGGGYICPSDCLVQLSLGKRCQFVVVVVLFLFFVFLFFFCFFLWQGWGEWGGDVNYACHLFILWLFNCICLSFSLVLVASYGSECIRFWVHLFYL